jgi:NADPH-dependent curcumin reductase CurA
MSRSGIAVRLKSRPVGVPTLDCFAVDTEAVPDPADGQVVVRNQYLSVDPYMRGRMSDAKSYVPPFALGEVLSGAAVGVVADSRSDALKEGATVVSDLGWREWAVGDAASFRAVDTSIAPATAFLGPLGMPGFTAYVGLLDIAGFRPDDGVFVSGAAGAVGGLVGQIARASGASRVIGSAGSDEKVSYLVETLGFDAAFNYRDGDLLGQLRKAAPERFDVYFDNVGGEHLEAAISAIRPHGRIALCGAISAYNATEPQAAPRNLVMLVGKRLTMRGFIIGDHDDRRSRFESDMAGWLADGSVRTSETVVEGADQAPRAFLAMLRGDNVGKMLVRVAPETKG